MTPKRTVLSVGELLVDFVASQSGVTLKTAPGFIKCAGGAPANVAVGIARLGTRSAFAGKVGNDSFGKFLAGELHDAGVDISGIVFDPCHKTRLAFVSLTKNGDRDFEFWEQHPADEQLVFADISQKALARAAIVNVGAFLLLRDPSRRTALEIAKQAQALGREVCFDPNLRLSLWPDPNEAKRVLAQMIRRSTILRLNDAEAEFFTGEKNVESAAERLRAAGPRLVVVTLGDRGSYYQTARSSGYAQPFRVKAVDTTGCGDGFLAGLLHGLAQSGKKPEEHLPEELQAICTVANAVGALVATKKGAIAAMPSSRVLGDFLSARRTG